MPRGTRKKRRQRHQEKHEDRMHDQDLKTMHDQILRSYREGDVTLSPMEQELMFRVGTLLNKGISLTLGDDQRLVEIWKRAMGYEWQRWSEQTGHTYTD